MVLSPLSSVLFPVLKYIPGWLFFRWFLPLVQLLTLGTSRVWGNERKEENQAKRGNGNATVLKLSSCPSLSYPGLLCFPPTAFLAAYYSMSLRRENGRCCCLCLGHLTAHLKTVIKLSFNMFNQKGKGREPGNTLQTLPEKCLFFNYKNLCKFPQWGMIGALDKSVLSVYHQ